MKNIKIEFTNERIIPASGLAVVGAILGKSDFVKRCNRMDVTKNRSQHQIKNGDILLTYIGLSMSLMMTRSFISMPLASPGASLPRRHYASGWMTLVLPCAPRSFPRT